MSVPSGEALANWQTDYVRRYYRSRPGWNDGTEEFHALCAACAPEGATVLEIGPGPSNPTSRYLATLGELHGLDPSDEVRQNDALKSASVLAGDRFPFSDDSIDLCVSHDGLEHVPDPAKHLAEIRRVLKPGGAYVFRTPNRFHYVSLVARATPHWVHELVANRLRNLSAEAHDPYPVLYRMNTERDIRRLSDLVGLQVETLHRVEKEPSYGMAAKPLFFAFMAYERVVNSTDWLAFARANFFGVLRKPSAQ